MSGKEWVHTMLRRGPYIQHSFTKRDHRYRPEVISRNDTAQRARSHSLVSLMSSENPPAQQTATLAICSFQLRPNRILEKATQTSSISISSCETNSGSTNVLTVSACILTSERIFESDERLSEATPFEYPGAEAIVEIREEKNVCNDEEGRVPMSERQVSL